MAKPKPSEALVLKVAMLYYEGGLTQREIANKYGVSRPTVVRMLKTARDEGFVQIQIVKTLPETTLVEAQIEQAFAAAGLREVVVSDNAVDDGKEAVAKAAGHYVGRTLVNSDIVGVGWSTTMLQVANYVKGFRDSPQRVVQLGGGIVAPHSGNTQELAFRLGQHLSATVEAVNAPVLVKNKNVRDALLDDPSIKRVNEWARKCTIALVGIGTSDDASTMVTSGYLTHDEIDRAAKAGAVGEILLQYFDAGGNSIKMPWEERVITQPLKVLRNIPNLVLVAAGAEKAAAVAGALHTGVVNTLIVDSELAHAVLGILRASESHGKRAMSVTG